MFLICFYNFQKKISSLTLRFSTPHRKKSTIFKSYDSSVGSLRSCLIIQLKSESGLTPRSSANSGAPLKPSGFFKRAVIESPIFDPCDENEHCMSVTKFHTKKKDK